MKTILIGIAVILGGIFLFYFIGALLNGWIRKPLVEFCMRHGQSASPWGMAIWEGIWGYELLTGGIRSFFLSHYIATGLFHWSFYPWLVLILAAFPFVVLLLKARLYFIPVLIIKILCIPLDIVYVVTGGSKDPDFVPQATSFSSGGGYSAGSFHPSSGSQKATYSSHHSSGSYQNSNSGNYNQPESGQASGGMPNYIAEKYSDQHRVREESDGSYSTVKIGGETASFNGDYVPFNESGGDVEIRTYDSDYAPMD